MTRKTQYRFFAFLILLGCISSCGKEETINQLVQSESASCKAEGLLETFVDLDGNEIFIYEDGKVYLNNGGSCEFELQYFDPDFGTKNYQVNTQEVFLVDGSDLVPVKNNFSEDFEVVDFLELFVNDVDSPDLFWTNFTLQSPQAKTVTEYVALAKCIIDRTCDFRDNRIERIEDPVNTENSVLKFSSVAPSSDMVTSKCSLTSVLNYFKKDSEVWYQADYYIESGMPYSIVDFETSYFEISPGPRIVIKNNALALENKFGAKLVYPSSSNVSVPKKEWFTLKVHLKYNNTENGIIQVWQDDTQIIDARGINLPTNNAIQNIMEIGISATQESTVLFMDNMQISNTAF